LLFLLNENSPYYSILALNAVNFLLSYTDSQAGNCLNQVLTNFVHFLSCPLKCFRWSQLAVAALEWVWISRLLSTKFAWWDVLGDSVDWPAIGSDGSCSGGSSSSSPSLSLSLSLSITSPNAGHFKLHVSNKVACLGCLVAISQTETSPVDLLKRIHHTHLATSWSVCPEHAAVLKLRLQPKHRSSGAWPWYGSTWRCEQYIFRSYTNCSLNWIH
jgi:hypothetical protein